MRSLAYLNKYFYRYRYRLLAGMIFVIVSNFLAIFPAQIVRHVFDVIANTLTLYKTAYGFSLQGDITIQLTNQCFMFGLFVIVIALLKGVFMYFMRQTIIVMSRLIEFDLKNEIYAHYQELDQAFYRRNNTGDLLNRISEDVSRVRMYVGPAIMYGINLITLFVLIITAMVNVNLRLTLFVLIPLPILALSIYFVSEMINKESERVQFHQSALSTFIQETFSGIRVLKSFIREEQVEKDFVNASTTYQDRSMKLARINSFFAPLMMVLIGLSIILTLYIGGIESFKGNITAGNIAEFIIYVNLLTWPVTALGWVTSIIQRAAASQQRINEFLETKPTISTPTPFSIGRRAGDEGVVSATGDEGVGRRELEFINVSYRYPGTGILAIDNISFTLKTGHSLGIIGKTGSGKSTIAWLMARMMDPDSGEVKMDGLNMKQFNLNELRSFSGLVPQDTFLFSDTIANNIGFGLLSEKISPNERISAIEEAAKMACIHENIMEFPAKYETRIGERGIMLSGGQKQRISIARALIRKPHILIFDDCLSAVDIQTEAEILGNVQKMMSERTLVLISHRVSAVKTTDHIIVIDEGQIKEQGKHEALIGKSGIYSTLFKQQQLDSEIFS